MFDSSAVLGRLAEHCRYLRGSECRLLVHLTALAVKASSLEVIASENQVAACLRLGHGQITRGKRRLAELGLVIHESGANRGAGCFYLRYLRELAEAPPFRGQVPPFRGQGTPVSGAGAPVSGAEVPPFQGQGAPVSGAGAPVSGAGADPGYSLPAGPPARARRIESEVVSIGSFSSIDRVLTTTEIPNERKDEAALLERYFRAWAAKHGAPGLAERPIDPQLIAQCLAIGSLRTLEDAWIRISERLNDYRVEGWGFFVTALVSEVSGFTPSKVKERRADIRRRMPAMSASDSTSFTDRLLHAGVTNVKNLA